MFVGWPGFVHVQMAYAFNLFPSLPFPVCVFSFSTQLPTPSYAENPDSHPILEDFLATCTKETV